MKPVQIPVCVPPVSVHDVTMAWKRREEVEEAMKDIQKGLWEENAREVGEKK